jgi:hypothetical protein
MMRPDMDKNTAASGGMAAPPQAGPPARSPDDSPMLTAPTMRPGEPVTAGLASGAGPGPESMTGFDPRLAETQRMKKKWMPYLQHLANDPETPESVKVMYRYLMGV